MIGAGPHTLNLEGRPDWFFDPSASGGILVDLASHQVDQFLAITGELNATVSHSSIGNVACHEHPAFADVGTIRLAGTTTHGSPVIGDHRVDLLSPRVLDVGETFASPSSAPKAPWRRGPTSIRPGRRAPST